MRRIACLLLLVSTSLLSRSSAKTHVDADKPRVFITDSQSWEFAGIVGGTQNVHGGHISGGARPQTAEIIKTFGDRCPQVVINNIQDRSDYVVVLDHEGGESVLRHRNKVAVFNHVSGDSIVSKSTHSLGGSVQDACGAIAADWNAHSREIRAAEAAATAAAEPKLTPVAMQQDSPQSSSSASSAQFAIASDPAGADIEIDGNFVGSTPSTVGVALGQHQISVKKPGFKLWERKVAVSSGQINVNAVLESETK